MTNSSDTPTTIYEVWYTGYKGNVNFWDAARTLAGAEELVVKCGQGVGAHLRKDPFIKEVEVATDFKIPHPDLRALYQRSWTREPTGTGSWDITKCKVIKYDLDNWDDTNEQVPPNEVVAEYTYNYPNPPTFEVFRQGDLHYALISTDYTASAVLDLQTGKVIAEEPHDAWGFCPVDFYVPDWWDVHDGSIIPGSYFWEDNMEQPCGQFGFVAGCVWGDDSSWKIEYLDLSKITEGVLTREQRFGYIEMARGQKLKDAVNVGFSDDYLTVNLRIPFDLKTGKMDNWTLNNFVKHNKE